MSPKSQPGRNRKRPIQADKLRRPIYVLTTVGPQSLEVSDPWTATLILEHHDAVKDALRTGNFSSLRHFARTIRIGGRQWTLETDPVALRKSQGADALSDELYDDDD